MTNSMIYQRLFDELAQYLPPVWGKLVVYLEYGEASYSFSFYVKTNKGYVKCFDLPHVDESKIMSTFAEIDEIIAPEREKETQKWSSMTMIVQNSGEMHTDFDYSDLSEGTYSYKKAWKEKYLN